MPYRIALLSTPDRGHVQRALLVTRGLVAAGAEVHAFSGAGYADDFRRAGAEFHDIHGGRPLESTDNASIPIPSRFVTFAAVHAESLAQEIARLNPSLIVHGTFAVVAVVVAKILGLPRVAICAGHNQSPRVALPPLRQDPRVKVSPACLEAVQVLRDRYGMSNASPFSYLDSLSPTLNIIPEPPEFLREHEIADFRPCAFFGSIDPLRHQKPVDDVNGTPSDRTRVYVSFGTIAHRYYAADIVRVMESIVCAAGDMPSSDFTITLGGSPLNISTNLPANVRVVSFLDQWSTLAQSDIYITHNGLNSTHEAVYLQKPMISFPLFADQHGMARRCEELGLALPLAEGLRPAVSPAMVRTAIEQVLDRGDSLRTRLRIARGWEDRVIAARPDVVRDVLACARG
jgi:MGT family glycosyltransferase